MDDLLPYKKNGLPYWMTYSLIKDEFSYWMIYSLIKDGLS